MKEEAVGITGSGISWILTAIQNDTILSYINTISAILASLVTIAYIVWKWYKKAKQDGKITKDEVEDLFDDLKDFKDEEKEKKKMIQIGDKKFRNLQEQVAYNAEQIEKFKNDNQLYTHDMMVSLGTQDSESTTMIAAAHIVFKSTYKEAYTVDSFTEVFKSKNLYPELYVRNQSGTKVNNIDTRMYLTCYLDSNDNISYEEMDEFFQLGELVEESVNTYRILEIYDKPIKIK